MIAIRRFSTCLATLLGAMLIYCGLIAPAFEPPERPQHLAERMEAPITKAGWWSKLFPQDAWQNANPMFLQTRQGTLLYKSLEQPTPEELRLANVTLILPLGSASSVDTPSQSIGAEPSQMADSFAIIEATEGQIRFERAFEPTSGNTPPVVGGLLKGDLTITGFDFNKGSAPQWKMRTRNVQIERRRLWTIEPVEIEFGRSIARGRELSITLNSDLLDPAPEGAGPWGMLDHLELLYVGLVRAELPPGGLWKDMKLGDPQRNASSSQSPAELQLRCAGALRFEFTQSLLHLTDRVQILHQVSGMPPDEFRCHNLQLRLEPVAEGKQPSADDVQLGSLVLKELDAIGVDSVLPNQTESWVRINAPNIGLEAASKRLQAYFQKKQFTLNGRARPNDQAVTSTVTYMGHTIRSPRIDYAAAKNKEHLGWLMAEGPGEMSSAEHPRHGQVQARWKNSLQMQPSNGIQVVTLLGHAFMESTRQGHLGGNRIDIRLRQNPESATRSSSDTYSEYQVDRVDAAGEVALGNGQQSMRVSDLHLQFVYAPGAAVTNSPTIAGTQPSQPAATQSAPNALNTSTATNALNSLGNNSLGNTASYPTAAASASPTPPANNAPIALSDSAGNPMYQWIGPQPPPKTVPGAITSSGGSTSTSMPLVLLGKELNSTIIVGPQQSWIDGLTIQGPLSISRDGPPTPNVTEWRIDGSQLQLSGSASNQFDIQIVGQPARLAFGDGTLQGPEIRLDQRTGHVQMDQPGEFTLPRELLSTGDSSQKMQWIKPLKCRWDGRMMFDGNVARIVGDIVIEGVVSTAPDRISFIEGNCKALDVKLTRAIDISKPKSSDSTLQSVTLREEVNIRVAQTNAAGARVSLEQIVVPQLTFDMVTNRVIGNGPGWVKSHHFASKTMGQTVAQGGANNARLQAVHLKFRDIMEGLLSENQIRFSGKVEVACSPIQDWRETIDLDSMQTLYRDQVLLSGDLLRAYSVTPPGAAHATTTGPSTGLGGQDWELQAVGNVAFEGRGDAGDYSGTAYRMTYSQAKSTLLIQGDGRIPADLRLRTMRGNTPLDVDLSIVRALLDTNTLRPIEVETTGGGVTRPSNDAAPLAPTGGVSAPPANLNGPARSSPRNGVTEMLRGNN